MRLADALEAKLRDGGWASGLPGYRTLATRYEVSNRTAIAALKLLEERGLLQPARDRRARQVAAGTASEATADKKTLLIIGAASYLLNQSDREMIHSITLFWESKHGRAVWQPIDLPRFKKPHRQLKRLLDRHGARVLLLCMPPRPWTLAAVELGVPFYLLGGDRSKIDSVSGSAFRLDVEIGKAVAHLRSLGHRRIALPLDADLAPHRTWVMLGFRNGWGDSLSDAECEASCPVFRESVPSVWQDYWKRLFAERAPTAVIVLDEPWFHSLYGFCFTNKIRIPEDLSVFYLGDSEILEWCHPPPTRMKYPVDKGVRHFQSWSRGGFKTIGMKVLPLVRIDGQSVAPPGG
ncbi:MAG: LacI family DNA-binding transcriptional regulator [Verrucomicrobiae bacterium]|nr:LacI family DNA-binding transcriptional regulator [Verrucomicrobiae bacterium]